MYIEKYYNAINYNYLNNIFENQIFISKKRNRLNNNKNFLVNNFYNYKNIFNIFNIFNRSLTLTEIKNELRNINQKVSGKKIELYKRMFFYMYLNNITLVIQKNFRLYINNKLNKLHGPANIKRRLCTNDTDFLTLDNITDIPYNEFFSYKDDCNFIYGFSIKSIYNLLKKKKLQNPFTTKDFNNDIINNINDFIKLSNILNIKLDIDLLQLDNINYDNRLINVFHEIDILGNYSNIEWFKNLNLNKKIIFLKELHDIWVYRANLSSDIRNQISPNGDPFTNLNINNIYNNIPIDNFNNICLNIIENFVLHGTSDSNRSLGALYVLSALTLVSHDAAQALPWLHQSVYS